MQESAGFTGALSAVIPLFRPQAVTVCQKRNAFYPPFF